MNSESLEIQNDNGTIEGRVSLPTGDNQGCVICLHGIPGGDFHGNTGIFDDIAERLIPHEFAVIQFSFYGALPSDGDASELCLQTQVTDYLSVLDYAREEFDSPIYVAGESAGATVAALEWAKGVDAYLLLWPAFDLKDTDLRAYITEEWWEEADQKGFFDDNGMIIGRELFLELLMTDFTDSFDLPEADIFLAHGQNDEEVPYEQSIRALEHAKGRTTFVTHPDAGHGFQKDSCRDYLLDAIEDWMR